MTMNEIGIGMVLVGLCGMVAATWLFPVLGIFFSRVNFRKARNGLTFQTGCKNIAVLIPVYNEALKLERSLVSILEASERLNAATGTNCSIYIGLDGCSDESSSIAGKFGVPVLENTINRGKWQTICQLAHSVNDSDWIIFADAGVIWDRNFLNSIWPYFVDGEHIAVAPAYRPLRAGIAGRLHWWLERTLKSLENRACGPVSVHGATVAYRSEALKRALDRLEGNDWKNDDVVIPMMLQALYPDQKLRYLPSVEVHDSPAEVAAATESNRRTRMMVGNVEWIHDIFPFVLRNNFTAGILCLRRLFRVLWGYSFVAIAAGSFFIISGFINTMVAGVFTAFSLTILIFLMRSKLKKLNAALQASLRCPGYLFSRVQTVEVKWR